MRTGSAWVAALGLTTAFCLAGCSSGGDSSSPTGAETATAPVTTAACHVAAPVAGAVGTALSPGVGADRGHGRVGVLLPGTAGAAGSSESDAEHLTTALERTGLTVEVADAHGDGRQSVSQAREMLAHGARVLVVDAVDDASGVRVERAAQEAGAQVIDFDRLTLGGSATYYVAFDSEAIGRLQAQTMVDCLTRRGVTDPRVLIMDGGTDVDDGAVLLDKGAHEVLDPLVAAGKVTIAGEAAVEGWDESKAAPAFRQALQASGGRVDAVLAANDDIAHAVIGVLGESKVDRAVVVTGLGSGVHGLRGIVTGRQSLTVLEDPRLESEVTARLAVALIEGRRPSEVGLRLAAMADPATPGRQVMALLLPAPVVTQANLQDVVDAGLVTRAALCRGVTERCAALGLT